MSCSRCGTCACEPEVGHVSPHLYPGQIPLFIDEALGDEALAMMIWAERLPAGRDYIYFKNAGPGIFSDGDAARHFGWDRERGDAIRRLLHKQNLIRERSWGVWEVTELARKTVLAPYVGRGLRDRLSPLAVA